jgi:hypothetical protein
MRTSLISILAKHDYNYTVTDTSIVLHGYYKDIDVTNYTVNELLELLGH